VRERPEMDTVATANEMEYLASSVRVTLQAPLPEEQEREKYPVPLMATVLWELLKVVVEDT
jgi:hypothetical protein